MYDDLLRRKYDYTHYNCVHFVIDVWWHLFDEDLSDALLSAAERVAVPSDPFVEIDRVPDRGFIVALPPKSETHIAVSAFGKIFHLTRHGARICSLEQFRLEFPYTLRFFVCQQ